MRDKFFNISTMTDNAFVEELINKFIDGEVLSYVAGMLIPDPKAGKKILKDNLPEALNLLEKAILENSCLSAMQTLNENFLQSIPKNSLTKSQNERIEFCKDRIYICEQHLHWISEINIVGPSLRCRADEQLAKYLGSYKDKNQNKINNIDELNKLIEQFQKQSAADTYSISVIAEVILNLSKRDKDIGKKIVDARKISQSISDPRALYETATCNILEGKFNFALRNLFLSIDFYKAGAQHAGLGRAYFAVGNCYKKSENYKPAIRYFCLSKQIMSEIYGKDHPSVKFANEKIEQIEKLISLQETPQLSLF